MSYRRFNMDKKLRTSLKLEIKKIPSEFSGVYFLKKGSEIVYIGKSKKVKERLRTHINDNLKDFDSFDFVCASIQVIDKMEKELIKKHNPKYNGGILPGELKGKGSKRSKYVKNLLDEIEENLIDDLKMDVIIALTMDLESYVKELLTEDEFREATEEAIKELYKG